MSMGSYLAIVKVGLNGLTICRHGMPDNERCSMPRNTAANRTRIVAREWRESGCYTASQTKDGAKIVLD